MISSFGFLNSRNNKSNKDYFFAGKNTPWWLAMFSIVATETSVLTFISIPGLAYRGDWFFIQLALGYIIGRILVSYILLPLYFKGNIASIYEIIGKRFGVRLQKIASATFLITRILADGIRFLATAVIVQVITGWPIWVAVLIIGIMTMLYTIGGGIRTIIWFDSFQFILYLIGGLTVISYIIFGILNLDSPKSFEPLFELNKFQIFRLSTQSILTDPWYFLNAIIGGVFLSFASHGADYMMVQRVLTCNSLHDARKAMIGSGFFVLLQFSVFLFAGSLIWLVYGGIEIQKDRELTTFIVDNYLPSIIKGVLLASVLSAAMSTLSSSINSLASSTIYDWMKPNKGMKQSRLISLFWSIVLIFIALVFDEGNSAIVVLGLKIASFTYGGLLSLFVLSFSKHKFSNLNMIVGFMGSIMTVLFLESLGIAWTWFILSSLIFNIFIVHLLHYLGFKKGLLTIIIPIVVIIFNNEQTYSSGLDQISKSNFNELSNKQIGMVVNHTSLNNNDQHLIELAHNAGLHINAIFSPEHGFKGTKEAGEYFGNSRDSLTGAYIYSLYGKNKEPTSIMLEGIDVILFDIQDIGVRYYTYISTLTNVMNAAAKHNIEVWILDRVNPFGNQVRGPINQLKSFVGMHPIPILHGMTIGELAMMINGEGWLDNGNKVKLKIIKYKGKINKNNKKTLFNPPPSPNMPDIKTAWLYQGICLLEGTNLSEGRGTDKPFKYFGAPWLNHQKLFKEIKKISSANDRFNMKTFIPKSVPNKAVNPKYKDIKCNGIEIIDIEDPLSWIVKVIHIIKNNHPNEFYYFDNNFIDKLYGSSKLREYSNDINNLEKLIKDWTIAENKFIISKQPYVLYD